MYKHTHTVLDENDNSPAFVETVYLYDVVENSNIVSLTVTATDMDSGDNQIIEYAIVSGNTNNTFAIVGELLVAGVNYQEYATPLFLHRAVATYRNSVVSMATAALVMDPC